MGKDAQWTWKREVDEESAKGLISEFGQYKWLKWKFIQGVYIPDGFADELKKHYVLRLAQRERISPEDISFDETYAAIMSPYDNGNRSDEQQNFNGYCGNNITLNTEGKTIDRIFGMRFTRAYGFLRVNEDNYGPAFLHLYRHMNVEKEKQDDTEEAPIPSSTFTVMAFDFPKIAPRKRVREIKKVTKNPEFFDKIKEEIDRSMKKMLPEEKKS